MAIVAAMSGVDTSDMSRDEAVAFLTQVAKNHTTGDILEGDEYAKILKALPAVGSPENSVSEEGTFQGGGLIEYDIAGAGVEAHVTANIKCEAAWGVQRMQWIGNYTIQKTGGEASAVRLNYRFYYMSFGTNDETGSPELIYCYEFDRPQNANDMVNDFNNGEPVNAIHVGTSARIQWAYCIIAECEVTTPDGILIA